MLFPKKPTDPGILLELKKGEKDQLDSLAKEALKQIKDKKYESQLREFGCTGPIFCYGIAASGKLLTIEIETRSF